MSETVTSHAAGERVLGIPRAIVPGGLGWTGIRTAGVRELLDVATSAGEYRPRAEVEDDPDFQQLIPYVVVEDGSRVFLMRRLRGGGDTRLHDRYSIGVGGHVRAGDVDLAGGLAREWAEELVADWQPAFEPIGLLNDDRDPVGAVHLGIVMHVDARGRALRVRETDTLEGWFAERSEVRALTDRLESWSRIVLDHLDGPEGRASLG